MNLYQQCICRHCRAEFNKPASGRPPIYCSDACKMKSYRQRKNAEETVTLRKGGADIEYMTDRLRQLQEHLESGLTESKQLDEEGKVCYPASYGYQYSNAENALHQVKVIMQWLDK